jgi:transposase-like protein
MPTSGRRESRRHDHHVRDLTRYRTQLCQAEFDVLYGQGMSHIGELLDLALEQGLIVKNGSWFAYQATRVGQGREQAKAFLQASAAITTALELQIRQNLGLAIPIPTG